MVFYLKEKNQCLTFLGDLSIYPNAIDLSKIIVLYDKRHLILKIHSFSLILSLSGITLPSWNELSWICNSHEAVPLPATQSRTVANRTVIYQKLFLWAPCLTTPGFDLCVFLSHTDKAVYMWDECMNTRKVTCELLSVSYSGILDWWII